MDKPHRLNGIDLDRLEESIEAIRDSPTRAKYTFQVHSRWTEEGVARTTIQSSSGRTEPDSPPLPEFVFRAAEPFSLFHGNGGTNPMEYLLIALGSCFLASLSYLAAVRGIEIQALESHLEGDLDLHGFLSLSPKVPRGFEVVRIRVRIRADAPEKSLQDLCGEAQRCSPVLSSLVRAVPIVLHVEKEG